MCVCVCVCVFHSFSSSLAVNCLYLRIAWLVKWLATGWASVVRFPTGRGIFPYVTKYIGSVTHPACYEVCTGARNLANHIHLVSMLRMHGALLPHLHMSS
jgi:hypothetical protein